MFSNSSVAGKRNHGYVTFLGQKYASRETSQVSWWVHRSTTAAGGQASLAGWPSNEVPWLSVGSHGSVLCACAFCNLCCAATLRVCCSSNDPQRNYWNFWSSICFQTKVGTLIRKATNGAGIHPISHRHPGNSYHVEYRRGIARNSRLQPGWFTLPYIMLCTGKYIRITQHLRLRSVVVQPVSYPMPLRTFTFPLCPTLLLSLHPPMSFPFPQDSTR